MDAPWVRMADSIGHSIAVSREQEKQRLPLVATIAL
jgi:hypothetical protein